MLLVPEIALTPQMLRTFAAHFGDDIAVLHSSLSAGERFDEWRRIKSGDARVYYYFKYKKHKLIESERGAPQSCGAPLSCSFFI